MTFLQQWRLASTDFSDHFSLISTEIKECSKAPLGMVGYLFPLVYCVSVSARGGNHTSWEITATNLSQTKWKIISTWINLRFTIPCKLLSLYATWEPASSDTALHVKHVKRRTTGSAHNRQLGQQNQWKSSCLANGLCQPHRLLCLLMLSRYTVSFLTKKMTKNACFLYQLLIMWQVSKHQSRKQAIRPVSRAEEHLHTLGFGSQIFLPLFAGSLKFLLGKMKCILYHPCSYLQWFPHIHSSNSNTPLCHLWLHMVWHILNE